jgi:NAD(P)H-nitrite reductase large subunit
MPEADPPEPKKTFAPRLPPGGIDIDTLADIVDRMRRQGADTVKLSGEIVFVWEEGGPDRDTIAAATGLTPVDFAAGGLRPVRLCAAETFCRRNKRPVRALAEELERRFGDRAMTMAKVVVGVAGCRRSCSEPATKDIGVIAGAAGYRLLVGGMNGFSPRIALPLAELPDEAAVVAAVEKILDYAESRCDPTTRLGAVIERRGIDELKKAVGV